MTHPPDVIDKSEFRVHRKGEHVTCGQKRQPCYLGRTVGLGRERGTDSSPDPPCPISERAKGKPSETYLDFQKYIKS